MKGEEVAMVCSTTFRGEDWCAAEVTEVTNVSSRPPRECGRKEGGGG